MGVFADLALLTDMRIEGEGDSSANDRLAGGLFGAGAAGPPPAEEDAPGEGPTTTAGGGVEELAMATGTGAGGPAGVLALPAPAAGAAGEDFSTRPAVPTPGGVVFSRNRCLGGGGLAGGLPSTFALTALRSGPDSAGRLAPEKTPGAAFFASIAF